MRITDKAGRVMYTAERRDVYKFNNRGALNTNEYLTPPYYFLTGQLYTSALSYYLLLCSLALNTSNIIEIKFKPKIS